MAPIPDAMGPDARALLHPHRACATALALELPAATLDTGAEGVNDDLADTRHYATRRTRRRMAAPFLIADVRGYTSFARES